MKYFKRIAGLALSATVVLTSMATLAAGQITWQVKDYITSQGAPYAIAYEQYLDGVATGYVVHGEDARQYGLKPYASSITHPVSWYDVSYPNYQYDEIWADGEYTGLTRPTGARLPYTAYKDFPFAWEVGGTHKVIAETRANFGGTYIGGPTYPKVYTGANADVIEENRYFGFDVFQVYENGKARDVEVVLDTEGNGVNTSNSLKANYMDRASDWNTTNGNITSLVNSGNGVDSAFYNKLASDMSWAYAGQRSNKDARGEEHAVPVFDYTNAASDCFDNLMQVNHYFHLSGPVYNNDGTISAGNEYGLKINAFSDVVKAKSHKIDENNAELAKYNVIANAGDIATGDWDYEVNAERLSYYTNNIITTTPKYATADWVYAGYEIAEPYRMYEYLSVEGIIFDGDIDNDGNLDTPVVFRRLLNANGEFATANPKVEWKYAWVEASYPHEIYMQKYVETLDGSMIATHDFRGAGKYAKVNYATAIHPTVGVESGEKNYQARLEWRGNDGQLYMTPYCNINEYAGKYIELSVSPDASYIGAYNYVVPGAPVVVDPASVQSVN